MKPLRHLFLYFILVAVVATTSSLIANRFFQNSVHSRGSDLHAWVHSQLELTPEQEQKLVPTEMRFKERQKHYTDIIRLGDMELAQALLQDREYSQRVVNAVDKIHQAQGALQKATLEHVFEMREALTPEQYEKLLNLTANALYQVESDP